MREEVERVHDHRDDNYLPMYYTQGGGASPSHPVQQMVGDPPEVEMHCYENCNDVGDAHIEADHQIPIGTFSSASSGSISPSSSISNHGRGSPLLFYHQIQPAPQASTQTDPGKLRTVDAITDTITDTMPSAVNPTLTVDPLGCGGVGVSGVVQRHTMTLVWYIDQLTPCWLLPRLCDLSMGSQSQLPPHTAASLESIFVIPSPITTMYCGTDDYHLPQQTPREVLDNCYRITQLHQPASPSGVNHDAFSPQHHEIDDILCGMGLATVADNLIGSPVTGGLSPTESRKLTIAETLVRQPDVLFLDDLLGLGDTASIESVLNYLRLWCGSRKGDEHQRGRAVLASLNVPPTVGIAELFDDMIILHGSTMLYRGPPRALGDFFQPIIGGDGDAEDSFQQVFRLWQSSQLSDELVPSSSQCSLLTHYYSSTSWTIFKKDFFKQLDAYQTNHIGQDGTTSTQERRVMEAHKGNYHSCSTMQDYLSWLSIVLILFQRNMTFLYRNTGLFIPRVLHGLVLGLVFGSIFWSLDHSDYATRYSAFGYMITVISFGNFIELPVIIAGHPIGFKHAASGLYTLSQYTLAMFLASIPVMIPEAIALCIVMSLMVGYCADTFGQWLLLLVIILCQSLNISAWFRMVAIIGVTPQKAQAISAAGLSVMTMVAGSLLSVKSVHASLTWIYYISPFYWTTQAIANIEFLSPTYDGPLSEGDADLTRQGELYINGLGVHYGVLWVGLAVLVLLSLTCVYLVITMYVYQMRLYHHSELQKKHSQQQVNQLTHQTASPNQYTPHDSQTTHDMTTEVIIIQPETPLPSISLAPYELSFSIPLSPALQNEMSKDNQRATISAHIQPGKILMIAGPSCSGKTTLLDSLASRRTTPITNSVCINGLPVGNGVRDSLGYAEQTPVFFPFLTVEETIDYAVDINGILDRLGDISRSAMIDTLLTMLSLKPLQHRQLTSAVSSSVPPLTTLQLRVIEITREIASLPSILLIDDPFGGQPMSVIIPLMRVLAWLRGAGCAICFTTVEPQHIIHLAESHGLTLIDTIVTLDGSGNGVFYGNMKEYHTYTSTDSTLSIDFNENTCIVPASPIITSCEDALATTLRQHNSHSSECFYVQHNKSTSTALLHQLLCLTKRQMRGYYRSRTFLYFRWGTCLLLSLFFGAMYYNKTSTESTSHLINLIVAVACIANYGNVCHGSMSLPVVGSFRDVYLTEKTTWTRKYPSFFWPLSILLCEMIWCVIGTIFTQIPGYLMLNCQYDFLMFLRYSLIIYIGCIGFITTAMLFAYSMPSPALSGLCNGAFFTVSTIFMGLSVNAVTVPTPWRWLYRALPTSHITEALVMPQFGATDTIGTNGPLIYDFLRDRYGLQPGLFWVQVGWLVLYTGITFTLACMANHFMYRRKT